MKRLVVFYGCLLCLLVSCKEDAKKAASQDAPAPADVELSAEEYALLGRKKLYMDWEYDEAKQALLKAVEGNPQDDLSHANLAWYWMLEDNKEKSIESIELARNAAPDHQLWVLWHGWICYFYKDYECAERYLLEATDLESVKADAFFVLGRMNYRNGHMEEALDWLGKAARDTTGRAARAMSLLLQGNKTDAQIVIDSMEHDPAPFEMMVLVGLNDLAGDREKALSWLDRNYEVRQPLLPWLRYMPFLMPLHEDPRFQDIVQKIGKPTHEP